MSVDLGDELSVQVFRLKRTLVHGEGVLPAETLAANAKRARILEETLLSADDAA